MSESAPARSYRALLILTLLLLLAAAMRLYHLMDLSLWLDEGYTYDTVVNMGPLLAAQQDMHPPLYYLLFSGWLALTGDSVLAMRAFSALLAILTVPLVYQLARRLVPTGATLNRDAIAALAMLLFILSDLDTWMGQEVRLYALHKLLVVLSAWLFLRWADRPNNWRLLLWIAATCAMLYTYYMSMLLIGVLGLYALVNLRGQQRWQAIGGFALVGLLFLPWFFTGFLHQIRYPNPLFVPGELTAEAWSWFLVQYFSGQWALVLGLIGLGAAVVHYRSLRDFSIRWLPDRKAAVLVAWVIVPFAFIAAVGLVRPFFSPRWPALVTPAIAILTARGLGNLHNPGRTLLVAVLLVYGLTTIDSTWPKAPWDDYATLTAQSVTPGDAVLMEVGNGDYPLGYYLDHTLPPDVALHSLRRWREATDPGTYDDELRAFLSEPDRLTIWVASWGDGHSIFDLLPGYGYTRTFTTRMDHVGNVWNVFRYDRVPDDPAARYESGMILRRVDVLPDEREVNLWWSVEEALTTDYSVSVFLLGEGGLIAQHDGYPQNGDRPTSTWDSAELIFDSHPLPDDFPPGRYTLAVQVYTWQDSVKSPTTAGDDWYTVGVFDWP